MLPTSSCLLTVVGTYAILGYLDLLSKHVGYGSHELEVEIGAKGFGVCQPFSFPTPQISARNSPKYLAQGP